MIKEVIIKKLAKISNLVQSIDDDNSISNLEKDLLLSYVRNLYDNIIDTTPQINKDLPSPSQKKDVDSVLNSLPKPIIKTAEPEPIKPPVEEEVITKIVEVEVASVPISDHVSEIRTVENINLAATKVPDSVSNESISEIFKIESGNDLSDKLSMSRLDDIRKGMGLNERLFTQKELFGDNSTHFNEVLDVLNNQTSFEAAKEYLIKNVIPLYKWDSENRIKKASTFVKLVRRKFL